MPEKSEKNPFPPIYKEDRPWGGFERLTYNEIGTTKIITVNPGEQLSIQYHHHRSERWRVVNGSMEVLLGDEWKRVSEGDLIEIPQGTIHAARGLDTPCVWVEISYGEFDENDIVRIEDKYGRT